MPEFKGKKCLTTEWGFIVRWREATHNLGSESTCQSTKEYHKNIITNSHILPTVWTLWWCFSFIIEPFFFVDLKCSLLVHVNNFKHRTSQTAYRCERGCLCGMDGLALWWTLRPRVSPSLLLTWCILVQAQWPVLLTKVSWLRKSVDRTGAWKSILCDTYVAWSKTYSIWRHKKYRSLSRLYSKWREDGLQTLIVLHTLLGRAKIKSILKAFRQTFHARGHIQ